MITWASRHAYEIPGSAPPPTGGSSSQDIFATGLSYGCDDPHAYNFNPSADITECCRYIPATLDTSVAHRHVRLALLPKGLNGNPVNVTAMVRRLALSGNHVLEARHLCCCV